MLLRPQRLQLTQHYSVPMARALKRLSEYFGSAISVVDPDRSHYRCQMWLPESPYIWDEYENWFRPVAAQNGHLKMATLLLKHGADVHARNSRSKSALTFARTYQHSEVEA